MKKIFYLFAMAFVLVLLTGCGNKQLKSQYDVGEDAYLDDIELKLTKVLIKDDQELELTFDITNNQDNTITISADNNFRFYLNQMQMLNRYDNHKNIIKKGQTISYVLNYDITSNVRKSYEILFYSGIVENNIKFNITSKDIVNQITE